MGPSVSSGKAPSEHPLGPILTVTPEAPQSNLSFVRKVSPDAAAGVLSPQLQKYGRIFTFSFSSLYFNFPICCLNISYSCFYLYVLIICCMFLSLKNQSLFFFEVKVNLLYSYLSKFIFKTRFLNLQIEQTCIYTTENKYIFIKTELLSILPTGENKICTSEI